MGLPQYTGVPQTAPPRKNRIDLNLFQAQKKLEDSMHMQMHFLETGDKKHLSMVAALTRSAWEDLNQNRRTLLAGKQSFKLNPRLDDDKPKLLTREEEQKVKPKPKFTRPAWVNANQATSSNNSQFNPQRQRSRSTDRKGKGKGKGKGEQP